MLLEQIVDTNFPTSASDPTFQEKAIYNPVKKEAHAGFGVQRSSTALQGFWGVINPLTEREEVQMMKGLKKLYESEELYKKLVKTFPEAVIVSDLEGLITYVSRRTVKLHGFTRADEILGKPIFELIAPGDNQKAMETLQKTLKKGEVKNAEYTMVKKDGSFFVGELNGSLIQGADGKPPAIIVTVRDITERMKMEEALRESEEKYRTLTNDINVGVYRNTIGPKGQFIEANPAIVKMFGYKTKEEFLALNVTDLYQHPQDRKNFNEKMLQDGFVRDEELQLKKKDGTPFIGSVSAVAVKDEEGNTKYYDGIVEDITERKIIEEALRESEARYKALFDKSLYSVYLHGLEGNFIDANEAALNLLGYTKEELPSLSFAKILEEDQLPKAFEVIEEIRKNGFQRKPVEYKLRKKNGKHVWVETEASAIYRGGTLYAIQGIARDITEKMQIEQQRTHLSHIANEILQRKNLDDILDTVAHAIQNYCGYGRVIIFLLDEAFETTHLAFSGLTETEKAEALRHHLSPEERRSIFQKKFKVGESYYIPHHEVPWSDAGVKSRMKPEQMRGWHPDDFLFIPLYGEGRKVVGLISVDDPADGKAPTAVSLAPVELFATQAAIAIENAWLYNQISQYTELLESKVRERTRKREALLETGYRLRETTSWDRGMQIIIEGITQGFGFESAEVFLINEARKILENIAVAGEKKRSDIPLNDLGYTASRCVAERKPVNIHEASKDPQVKKQIEPVMESFAWIPIMTQDDVLGAISVFNKKSGKPISNDDLDDVVLFANQAAHFVVSTRSSITPAVEKTLSSKMKYDLREGESYLIEDAQPAEAFDIFLDAVTHGIQGFSICRIHPKKVRHKYGLKKTPIMWLSTIGTEDAIDPKDLAKINHILNEFLKRAEDSVILLEGVEYLIIQNSFDKVIKALHSLNDYITIFGSRLLIPVNPKTLDERELSILEKEFRVR